MTPSDAAPTGACNAGTCGKPPRARQQQTVAREHDETAPPRPRTRRRRSLPTHRPRRSARSARPGARREAADRAPRPPRRAVPGTRGVEAQREPPVGLLAGGWGRAASHAERFVRVGGGEARSMAAATSRGAVWRRRRRRGRRRRPGAARSRSKTRRGPRAPSSPSRARSLRRRAPPEGAQLADRPLRRVFLRHTDSATSIARVRWRRGTHR